MRIYLAIATSLLVLSACSTTTKPTKTTAASAETPERVAVAGLASWARHFNTLEALVEASDVIVVGKIKGDGAIQEPAQGRKAIATDYELDVKKVLKDHKQRNKLNSLILRQPGAITNEAVLELHDHPLFKKNQRVVLFLREFEAGKVVIIGGPNGRFHIESDRIVPVDKHGITVDPNMSEQKFVDDVESIVKTGKKKL